MRRILALAVLLTLTLLASCKEVGQSEWETLCRWVEGVPLSCEGIDPPSVVYFQKKLYPSTRGYYRGGNLIYISDRMEGKQKSSTIFHETVHYLQVMSAGFKVPGPARQICYAEEQAFIITDIYRDYIGLDKIGDDWWRPYWYCWAYYAPQGSKMIILKLPDGEIIIDIMQ